MTPPENNRSTRKALRLVGFVGVIVSVSILTGTVVGIKLDGYLGGGGMLIALGVLLGVCAGVGLAGWLLLRASQES